MNDSNTKAANVNLYASATNVHIAGYWYFGNYIHLGVRKKPNWFHKLMYKWLLDWTWKDSL